MSINELLVSLIRIKMIDENDCCCSLQPQWRDFKWQLIGVSLLNAARKDSHHCECSFTDSATDNSFFLVLRLLCLVTLRSQDASPLPRRLLYQKRKKKPHVFGVDLNQSSREAQDAVRNEDGYARSILLYAFHRQIVFFTTTIRLSLSLNSGIGHR